MKKFIALLAILALCVAVAIPAVASGTFVGSPVEDSSDDHNNSNIQVGSGTTGNDTPPLTDKDFEGIDGISSLEELMNLLQSDTFLSIDDCIVVTNVVQAREKQTDISQEDRDLLLSVYDQLVDGTMNLPIDESFSVRDLLDVSFKYEGCRMQEDHGNKAQILALPGVTLSIDFNLGVDADEKLIAMTYMEVDGEMQWVEIVSTTNNGDGTVTCVFEDICPVAFAVLD